MNILKGDSITIFELLKLFRDISVSVMFHISIVCVCGGGGGAL